MSRILHDAFEASAPVIPVVPTHKFDTGKTVPQRTRIQQGAVQLLSGLKKSNGGYLVEVMAFPFTLKPTTSNDDAAQFVTALSRAPSIAVAVGDRDSEVRGIGGFQEWGDIELLVYFSSNNARNMQVGRMEIDAAGLADLTADPGLHVVMEHAKELLIGQRAGAPGSDIKQIRPVKEEEIWTAQPITIWLQTYKITVLTQISEFRTVTQLLESIRFRAALAASEVHLPAAKADHATVDVRVDDLS